MTMTSNQRSDCLIGLWESFRTDISLPMIRTRILSMYGNKYTKSEPL